MYEVTLFDNNLEVGTWLQPWPIVSPDYVVTRIRWIDHETREVHVDIEYI